MAGIQTLGTMAVKLIGDGTRYQRMLEDAEKQTTKRTGKMKKDMDNALESISKGMRSTGTQMAIGVTLPVVGMVKAFSNFDEAMVKSTAIMGDMSASMREEMEVTARMLSLNTVTSATEAAEAYYFLASAGMDAAQSMAALPVVEKFATAGAFNMATATDLLTDAQSALGLSSKDATQNMANMTYMSDVLVKAATLANASVQQFSESITNGAGTAMRTLNMDIEEGTAILATYADKGIKGNLAGSNLERMLRLTTLAINENRGAFDKLGVDVSDFAATGKNFTQILVGITKATEGMGPAQKAATLDALGFQARVQGTILPLLGATDAIRDYEKELKAAGGITKEVAEEQLKSFSAQIKIVWNRVKDVAISIGDSLSPAVRLLASALSELTDIWRALPGFMQTGISVIVGVTAAVGPLLIGLGTLGLALAKARLSMTQFGLSVPPVTLKLGMMASKALGWASAIAATGFAAFEAGKLIREWIGLNEADKKLDADAERRMKRSQRQLRVAEQLTAAMKQEEKSYLAVLSQARALNYVNEQAAAVYGEIARIKEKIAVATKYGREASEIKDLNRLLKVKQDLLNSTKADAYLKSAGFDVSSMDEFDKMVKSTLEAQLSAEEKITKEIENRYRLMNTIKSSVDSGADPVRTLERVAAMEKIIAGLENEKAKLGADRVKAIEKEAALALKLKKEAEKKADAPFKSFIDGLKARFMTPADKLQKSLAMLKKSYEKGIGNMSSEKFEEYKALLVKDSQGSIGSDGFSQQEAKQATILKSNISMESLRRGVAERDGPKEQVALARQQVEETKRVTSAVEEQTSTFSKMTTRVK